MSHIRILTVPALMIIVVLFFLSACRSGEQRSADRFSGTIKLSGAWALYPMAVAWAGEYQKLYPEVRIDISAGGAGKGMADALSGMVDIGMVSREIYPVEIEKGAVYVPVAKDAVVCVINAKHPLAAYLREHGATREALQNVWMKKEPHSGAIFEVDFSNVVLNVYTRSDAAGAPETWALFLGGHQEDLNGTGVYGDPGVVEAVRQDSAGIGYCNLNFAYDADSGEMIKGIIAVPIDCNGNGKVDPNEQIATKAQIIASITAAVYPSPPARDLYFVTRQEFKGAAAGFTRWVLTDGQKMLGSVGYINPSAEQIVEAVKLVTE